MYWQLFKLIKTNYLRNKARVGYLKIIVAVPCKAVLYNLSFHLVYFVFDRNPNKHISQHL